MTKKGQTQIKLAGFVNKLLQILKNNENSEIVAYNQLQRSLVIKNVRRFTEEILPKYFKHRNYSSFIRQVNLYDFHKIRQQGKQQAYQNNFFIPTQLKQMKKIKRKPMGFQKQRIKKKNECWDSSISSQQQENDNESQQSQQQLKSSDQLDNNCRQEMTFDIQELQKKKIFLQNKIRSQQIANEKLQYQNLKLKNLFFKENNNFQKQTLIILQNLLISQYHQQLINKEIYQKLIIYIYSQQQKISLKEQERQNNKNEKILQPCKQSKFYSYIKNLLTKQKQFLTIYAFIMALLAFIENQQNRDHPQVQIFGSQIKINNDLYYRQHDRNKKQQIKIQQGYGNRERQQDRKKKILNQEKNMQQRRQEKRLHEEEMHWDEDLIKKDEVENKVEKFMDKFENKGDKFQNKLEKFDKKRSKEEMARKEEKKSEKLKIKQRKGSSEDEEYVPRR